MSGTRPLDVLVIGDLFLDLVMSGFESWPNPGEEAFALGFFREAGGGAAITAAGLAKLGARVGVLGAVGAMDGEWFLARLASLGVDRTAIRRSVKEPTAVTVSVSGAAERAYFTYMGANRELPELLRASLAEGSFPAARHVHLACAPAPNELLALLRAIANRGSTISMDVGWHPDWLANPTAKGALQQADIFFPNEREAALVTAATDPARMLELLQDAGLPLVALKLGAQGGAVLSKGHPVFQKSKAINSVDTTGAGDCFDAGFLDAWLRGEDPAKCLEAGVACGALSTRAPGGISAFPTREELDTAICRAK
jgi:sugar/nucleoside kinase (ribokinase family)